MEANNQKNVSASHNTTIALSLSELFTFIYSNNVYNNVLLLSSE